MPTIAVLSCKPAFASVLATTLRHCNTWRVRQFSTGHELMAYMHFAPVAVVVADYDLGEAVITDLAAEIRHGAEIASLDVQIIALADKIRARMRDRCIRSGIDEIIAKPMSPLYLEQRIRARLDGGTQHYVRSIPRYVGPERRGRVQLPDARGKPVERRTDNVIVLSAHRPVQSPPVRPDA